MLRMLRVEGRKAFLNVPFWVLFALMVLASLAWSNGSFSRLPAVLTAGSGAAAVQETITRGEYVFTKSVSDSSFTGWLAVAAGGALIGSAFSGRTVNNLIYSGHRRTAILFVKLFYFYLSTIILSGVYPLVCCLRFSLGWLLTGADRAYVLRCLAFRLVIDMAMMTFSLIPAFIFRENFVFSMGCSLVVVLLLSQGLSISAGAAQQSAIARFLYQNFPACALPRLTSRAATPEIIVPALIFNGVMVLGTVITCYLLFRRANLD